MTSRVGFTDEILLGLEDGLMVGGAVKKDGEDVGDVVGVLDSCNDGGSDKDAVGAGVEDDEKVSYKYTLSKSSLPTTRADASAEMSTDDPNSPPSPMIVSPTAS